MKTLSKIKLNQFTKAELEQRAMNYLRGGSCGCSCSCSCSSCGNSCGCSGTSDMQSKIDGVVASSADNTGDKNTDSPVANYESGGSSY